MKGIRISDEMAQYLGVDCNVINDKMQKLVDSRRGLPLDDAVNFRAVIDFYREHLSKDELIALCIDAGSEAGFLKYKMHQLVSGGHVSVQDFAKVMRSGDIPDSEIEDMFGSPDSFL